MLDFAIFAVTFVLALIVAVIYLYPSSKKTTTIPGLETTSDDDGNLSDIKTAGSLHEFLLDLHKQFGPIASFWLGRHFVVSVASPELFKEQQLLFDRPAVLFKMFEPMFGEHSIQYSNKGEGRTKRQWYDRALSAQAMKHYYDSLQKLANDLVGKWETMLNDEHIPLSQYMMAIAIKANVKVSFGDDTMTEERVMELRKNYDISFACMEETLLEGPPAPGSDREIRFQKALTNMKEVVKKILEDRKKKGGGDMEDRFVDLLTTSGFDDQHVMCDAITYMVGGFHTTGNLLTWAFYFLASHPDVQDRAAEEVKANVGDEDVDHENVESLVYIRQILDETLRSATLAPYASRYQESDSVLGGHFIPKETPVIHALGVMLHDEKYWPHPNKFDPDRFNAENTMTRPNLVFQPFGFAGKRKCPGYRLAYAEGAVVLATVLRRFRISLVEGQVVTPVFGIVCHPGDEIWIQLSERE